jgi:hypothetical protein
MPGGRIIMAASTCNEDDGAPVGQALPLLWRDEGSVLMMAREEAE